MVSLRVLQQPRLEAEVWSIANHVGFTPSTGLSGGEPRSPGSGRLRKGADRTIRLPVWAQPKTRRISPTTSPKLVESEEPMLDNPKIAANETSDAIRPYEIAASPWMALKMLEF